MKLLFAYTEFLNRDGTEHFHRGFSRLSLNFSCDRHFFYQDGILASTALAHPIPTGFWGNRIYNVTTIVGDNGSGKTTILHYLINLLQQLYEGKYRGNDRGFLVIEDNKRGYIINYGKYQLRLDSIPDGFDLVPFNGKNEFISTTKLIYIANTLTQSDRNLVRPRPLKTDDKYVGLSHFRYEFLFNCSIASLMIENYQNDSGKPIDSVADYLNCFFAYEQYKQVKYVFDKRQFDILKKLRKNDYPVPVPEKLVVELQCTNYHTGYNDFCKFYLDNVVYNETMQYDLLLYELCSACVEGFEKTAITYSKAPHKNFQIQYQPVKWDDFCRENVRENSFLKVLDWICEFYCDGFQSKEYRNSIRDLYKCCKDFLRFIIREKEQLERYFEIESLNMDTDGETKKTITFSVKTTGESAAWFINFLQKYRYTCEPYYYLQFRWGLSSGEQNLLRMFSSLYYIFDADYNNPKRGDCKIYNVQQDRKVCCNSVMLWIDEADLTYHPEWQRRFISILTAFLSEIYPKSCSKEIQIFLTTHSPLMLGDSPAQSVAYLSKNADGHVIIDDSGSRQTFGENLYTLLRSSFHVQSGAIGELVRSKIQDILKILGDLDKEIPNFNEKVENSFKKVRYYRIKLQRHKESTVAFLADGIIKAKLEIEIDRRLQKLDKIEKHAPASRDGFTQWSNARLERQLRAITEELNRRKEDF